MRSGGSSRGRTTRSWRSSARTGRGSTRWPRRSSSTRRSTSRTPMPRPGSSSRAPTRRRSAWRRPRGRRPPELANGEGGGAEALVARGRARPGSGPDVPAVRAAVEPVTMPGPAPGRTQRELWPGRPRGEDPPAAAEELHVVVRRPGHGLPAQDRVHGDARHVRQLLERQDLRQGEDRDVLRVVVGEVAREERVDVLAAVLDRRVREAVAAEALEGPGRSLAAAG